MGTDFVLAAQDAKRRFAPLSTVMRRPRRGVFTRARLLEQSSLSNGTDVDTTYSSKHLVVQTCTDVQFEFGNFYQSAGNETDGPNAITVAAALVSPAGTIYPATFNGPARVTISPGGRAKCDPIGATCTKGETWSIRTYVLVASVGQKWPLGLTLVSANSEGKQAAVDKTVAGSSAVSVNGGTAFTPIAILAKPVTSTELIVWGLVGDSWVSGTGDFPANNGFVEIALAGNYLAQYVSWPSDQASFWASTPVFAKYRRPMLDGCTDALCELAINNMGPTQKANSLLVWKSLAQRGLRVRATTCPPRTTSTDAWTTLANQTVISTEADRLDYNAWIRGGAPIDATTLAVAAVGAANSITAGATNHPLVGVIEIADTIESARDSGKWKAPGAAAANVASASLTSNLITLTTDAPHGLVAGDTVAVLGSNATFNTNGAIVGTVTSTTLTYAKTAADTSVGAGGTVWKPYTNGDGIHPSKAGHTLAAVPIAAMFAAVGPVSA